jgi:hypothetical protein
MAGTKNYTGFQVDGDEIEYSRKIRSSDGKVAIE